MENKRIKWVWQSIDKIGLSTFCVFSMWYCGEDMQMMASLVNHQFLVFFRSFTSGELTEQGINLDVNTEHCFSKQNHGITESQNGWSWKGPLEVIFSTHPAQARSPTAGCPGPCPCNKIAVLQITSMDKESNPNYTQQTKTHDLEQN